MSSISIKAIVFRAAVLSMDEGDLEVALPRLWREHSLLALTEMARPVLMANLTRLLTATGELQEKIQELAQKIDAVDPGSYSFRYPVTSRGESALPSRFLTNIFTFSERIEYVLDDIAHFCRSLEKERMHSSDQMKLALHVLTGKGV